MVPKKAIKSSEKIFLRRKNIDRKAKSIIKIDPTNIADIGVIPKNHTNKLTKTP
jgi:hypothetical protein